MAHNNEEQNHERGLTTLFWTFDLSQEESFKNWLEKVIHSVY